MNINRIAPNFIWIWILIGVSFIGFTSCSNEIKVNAEWKETLVAYCLLDTKADTQFLRLGKAFLNQNTGALQIARDYSDSIYPDSVIATLKDMVSGKVHTLKRWNAPKGQGLFNDDRNPVYIMIRKNGDSVLPNREYELEVKNPRTNYHITARTSTVGPSRIQSPFRNTSITFSFNLANILWDFISSSNAAGADGKFLLHYTEMEKNDTNIKVSKTIVMNSFTSIPVSPNENTFLVIPQRNFYTTMRNMMGEDSTKYRRIESVGMRLYTGNQMLMDYISINEPSLGVVQKQAEYTNINGGWGLFASRCYQVTDKVKVEPSSIVYLQKDSITKVLNIIR